jgi:MYXO-CTERM domain-containing protein
MKTQRKQQRSINSISTGRWTAYAAAAAASGFAPTHTAEATIHYSGLVNQNIIDNRAVIFPLDPAGGSFLARHSNNYYGPRRAGGGAFFRIYGAQSASVNGIYGGRNFPIVFPYKLDLGYTISAGHFTSQHLKSIDPNLAYDYMSSTFDSEFGYFLERGFGLVGFKFNNGAGVQYGWVRVKMTGGLKNTFKVVDYAYGDPGDVVLAGQKSDDSAPGLESLGGLALGAAGLLAWRRRRSS